MVLYIEILFMSTYCELLKTDKTFTMQFYEQSMLVLGGFTQVLFTTVAVCGYLLLRFPVLGYAL